MILPIDWREFGLEKEPVSRMAALRQAQQGLAHTCLVVMDELVGGIDGRKAGGDGFNDELGRRLLLPGRSIHKGRQCHAIVRAKCHRFMCSSRDN
jgi:hypothetical protein